jgi:hypothetical protein
MDEKENNMATTTSTTPRPAVETQNGTVWKWLFLVGIVMAIAVVVMALRGDRAATPATAAPALEDVLAPFLAVAVIIERFWEGLFSWYEGFALATARLLGVSQQTTAWMKKEVENAEAAVTTLVAALDEAKKQGNATPSALLAELDTAEKRLLDARERITESLKTPEYRAFKLAVTTLGSLGLGVIVSVSAQLTMLHAAGLPVPPAMDVLLTGLLIGAGPCPLHTLIKSLQEFRQALAGLADLAKGNGFLRTKQAVAGVITAEPSTTDTTTTAPTLPAQPPAATDSVSKDRAVRRTLRIG